MVELQPNGNPVTIEGVTLRTPGLAGTATAHLPAAPGTRGVTRWREAFRQAMEAAGMEEQLVIDLSGTREEPLSGGVATRSTHVGEPAIEAGIPAPSEGWGQLVLYTDESGMVSWSFARDEEGEIDATRGAATRTYLIPRRVAPAGVDGDTRGWISAVGKKLLDVLVFPLLDPVIGEVGEFFVRRWENHRRPYRIRTWTPGNYDQEKADLVEGEAWRTLAGGRALLMVHGTFSRAHTGFGGLEEQFVAELSAKYGGRMFALDHPTASQTPTENVEWFLRTIPDGVELNLDIVCHSRGGLVSRELVERQSEFSLGSRRLDIDRVVMVAVPNTGTALADAKHLGDFVDTYTNILNVLPDSGVTDVLDGIITVAKQLATGVLKGLDGLQSMNPNGAYQQALNRGGAGAARYYALAGNFEPADRGLAAYAKDFLADKVFGTDNDLVVPTEGVWGANGSGYFPIQQRHVFGTADGVGHTNFFANAQTAAKLKEWLA